MEHFLNEYLDWLEDAYYDATEPPEVERLCRCCDCIDTLTDKLAYANSEEAAWIQDRIDALNASMELIY